MRSTARSEGRQYGAERTFEEVTDRIELYLGAHDIDSTICPPRAGHTVASVNGSQLPNGVTLRPATTEDVPELVRLARAFYDEDGFTTSDARLRENFRLLVPEQNAHVVVAFKDGRMCAFALTTAGFTLESGLIAELQDLYVRPEERRRGLASALIADATEWARARSATLLELVVAPNGQDVSHLFRYYEARGFVDEDRRILSRFL